MSIRKTIFDSQNERELFTSIESQWAAHGFALYPQLPFRSVFDITKLNVTPEERSFLFKTSIDYTLCTKDGQPQLSIEFDGVSHGFSRHGEYIAVREAPRNDPRRHWKLDLKVRLATTEGYPLLVVSHQEKNSISEDTHLTILDGAIGQVLAAQYFRAHVNEHVAEAEAQLTENTTKTDAHEYLQDAVSSLEVDADLKWNPLARAAAKAHYELFASGISSGHSESYLDPPGVPAAVGLYSDSPEDVHQLEARLDALNRATKVGCRVTFHTRLGPASADAWVRNMEHADVRPLGLAEDIAKILAAQRAREMFRAASPPF